MLVEFKNVRPEPGMRRWFEGGLCERVGWDRPDGAVEGFQILDRREPAEHALAWRAGDRFKHSRVDNGTGFPLKNLTPVLPPNEGMPRARVRSELEENSGSLEPELRAFVRQRLEAQA